MVRSNQFFVELMPTHRSTVRIARSWARIFFASDAMLIGGEGHFTSVQRLELVYQPTSRVTAGSVIDPVVIRREPELAHR